MKDIFTIFFQSFFGDTIVRMPKSTSLRIIVLTWCIFSFLMTTAFAAKLISSLVKPNPEPNIDTIDQLLNTNLTLYTTDATLVGIKTEMEKMDKEIHEYFNKTDLKHWAQIKKSALRWKTFDRIKDRLNYNDNDNDQLNQLMNDTNATNNAFVVNKYLADYMVHKHFDKIKDRSHYHVMHECLFHLPMVYFVEKNSPYLARINELLSQFHEAGFMSYWHRWSLLNDTLNNNYHSDEVEDEPKKVVIKIEHLASAFAVWAVGVGLSLMVFFLELKGVVT